MRDPQGVPTRDGRPRVGVSLPSISRRFFRRMPWILVLAWVVCAGTPAAVCAQALTLSVAISMKEAVEEIGRRFVQDRSTARLHFNFGGSGELQKQIEAGAPVDIFVSAADRQMDELDRKGLILRGSRRTFARNALAVVVPADTRLTISQTGDLLQPEVQRIAIGNPKTVPAGQYAEESLRTLGLWDAVRGKLVFGENVRQVLQYVARGEVEAGFVYVTDLTARPGSVKEAFRPPQNSHAPVTYPAAIVAGSRHPTLAEAFIALLLSRDGQDILARLGFLPPTERR
jgi:molybdate transport system substrate-binding protein